MDGHYGNAMTEIALALAMAFFSIMVLAMVSMGAGSSDATIDQSSSTAMTDSLQISPSKPSDKAQPTSETSRIIVFYQGQYLSDQLKPVDPTTVTTDGKIVLAVDPTLPLADAMQARAGLSTNNITVTTLDQRWMRALEEITK